MRTNAPTHNCPTCGTVELCFIDWFSARETGTKTFFCLGCDTPVAEATVRDVTFPSLPEPVTFLQTVNHTTLEEVTNVLLPSEDGRGMEVGDALKLSTAQVPMPAFQDEVAAGNALASTEYIEFYDRFRKAPLRYFTNKLHIRSVAKIVWWETFQSNQLPVGARFTIDNRKSKLYEKPSPEQPWGGTVISVEMPQSGDVFPPLELRDGDLAELPVTSINWPLQA